MIENIPNDGLPIFMVIFKKLDPDSNELIKIKNGRPTDDRRFLNVMNEGSCKTETGQKMEPLPFHSKQNNMQVT